MLTWSVYSGVHNALGATCFSLYVLLNLGSLYAVLTVLQTRQEVLRI